MATVTGMTAAAMIAIRAATVVSGAINGSGHLILTTYDGTQIDAGSIPSAIGSASLTAQGIVELATDVETAAGTDNVRAVTPFGLSSVLSGKQTADGDLTAIANLTPANDDIIQRKSGAWVNRTITQLYADIAVKQTLASNALAETALPSSYPPGLSTMALTTGSGWSRNAGFGSVVTNNFTTDRVSQWFYSSSGGTNLPQAWFRHYSSLDGGGGWTQWQLVIDTDLAVIGALSPANDDIIQRKAGSWVNRSIAQLAADIQAATPLQPLDSDLTAIAAIAPANDDVIQRKAGAWINRTMAQLATDILATNTVQALNTNLTAIAGLAPANDDIIQRKGGVWVNRTMAQLVADTFALQTTGGTMTNTINGIFGAATTPVIGTLVTGTGGFDQFRIYPDGVMEFGNGAGARDTKFARLTPNAMSLLTADFLIGTVGRGIRIAEGTNAKMGTATLVTGTVTVSNTSVTANSRIFLTAQNTGGTPGALRVSARTPGTSFTITSTSGSDTSLVAYEIKEPA
jgi:hypothetical protein